jgi:double-strand break repair protein AddB
LPLTAPGRLLRHVAEMRGAQIDGVALLTLLKHPLTHTGEERGEHLRLTRDLELGALRRSMPFPDRSALLGWAGEDDQKQRWAHWIGGLIETLASARRASLADHVAQTLDITERLAAGSRSDDPAELWDKEAGRVARTMLDDLQGEAEHGGEMSAGEFRDLFTSFLNGGDVRETTESHPGVMIWGTLEARVQGVDLVILGGLQDGTWPQTISPDPWMNRAMRKQAGLLLPERQIGLSAHDFQMAFGTREVILTRALRDDESETVPSRWINRLTNLMSGMSDAGRAALDGMRGRGKVWLDRVQDLETPEREVPSAIRPAPMPPVEHRPNRLSFTQVGRLVRDPYAIYAQKILHLSPIDALHKRPDAPLRGTILHEIFERFVSDRTQNEPRDAARERLLSIARDVLENGLPWPAARILWLAKIARNADWFLDGEAERQAQATDILTELRGEASFFDPPFTLHGRADRMDVRADGRVALFDYKTGQIPTKDQQRAYDKQLLLEALVLKVGGFDKLGRADTAEVAYIGLGSTPKVSSVEVEPGLLLDVEKEFEALIQSFRQPSRGYVSRRVMFSAGDGTGDFDHLARYGEWDHAEDPTPEPVGDHDG